MRNISNIKGVLYAVVSSATFGLIPLFSIPLLHAGMASPTILFYRMLLSAAIMAAVALLLKRNFRISRRDFGVLAGLSLMYAATSLGLLRSYDYIPSGVATTVNFLYPLVVTIVMTLFFRERSSVWIVIAVFISLVGVALLAWGDAGNNDPGRGLIYAGTTVFTYAVYIIGVMKSRAGRLDPLIVAFYVLTFSAAVFLVYALSTSGIAVVHTWHIWRNLLLLALLPTVLSNLTLVLAHKYTLTGGVILQRDEINQTTAADADNPDMLGILWVNYDDTKTWYAAANLPIQPTEWLQINMGANYMRRGQRVEQHAPETFQHILLANVSATIELPANFYVDLSYRYQSRMTFGNATVEPMQFLNAEVKKRFGRRFTLSFSARSLLDEGQEITAQGDGFVRRVITRQPWCARSYQIGITCNFKSGKAFRKKSVEAGASEDKGRM